MAPTTITSEPEKFQKQHTDYEGNITADDKVCMECYMHTVVRVAKEKPTTTDENLECLINASMADLPVQQIDENQLLDAALKLAVIDVAQELLENHALTLLNAHSIFQHKIESLLPRSTLNSCPDRVGTPRWLLGQLSYHLKHHMAHTCRVKKHGTIIQAG